MSRRIGVTVAVAIGVIFLVASPALAHVTVDPAEAPQGSITKLTFRVPSELALATTVKFDVKLGDAHPLTSVSVKPKAGWTPNVIKRPLNVPLKTADGDVSSAVTEISWSGGTIAPGQFDEFEVFVGPLPAGVDVMLFPSVQTYSDGTEVSWNQQSFDGQPAPDHPEPQLKLKAAAGTKTSTSSGGGSSTLAGAAFFIGTAGLALASWAWWNVRRWR
jgi:uncharacterized protein YcnI